MNFRIGDGTFSFDEFVQLMYNMGNLAEISEEQEEAELREAFKVNDTELHSNDLKQTFKAFPHSGI